MTLDARLKRDLNALIDPRRADAEALPAPKVRDPIAAASGLGRVVRNPGSGTAGMAWPLTEADAGTRTFHPTHIVVSTDGSASYYASPVHEIDLTDGQGSVGKLVLADPYAPP